MTSTPAPTPTSSPDGGALRVVALIPTDPAEREQVAGLLADLVTATRAEEGCLSYEAFESAVAPGLWVTVESWRAQADLDAHMATPHIASAIGAVTPLLTGEIAIHPLTPLA